VSLTTVTASATPQYEFEQRTTRPVKVPKPKRVRYNPNAPIIFDTQEIEAMAGSNPLNRKRLREEAKRRKKAPDDMVVDDQDGSTNDVFTFKPSVSAFAVLAAEDVPLPDEDEDEEL
jgi:nuclear GTP-binding protein